MATTTAATAVEEMPAGGFNTEEDEEEECEQGGSSQEFSIVDDNARIRPTRRVSWNKSLGKRPFQIAVDNARTPTMKIRVQGRLAKPSTKSVSGGCHRVGGSVSRSLSYDTIACSKGRGKASAPPRRSRSTTAAPVSSSRGSSSRGSKLFQRPLIRHLSIDDMSNKSDRRWRSSRGSDDDTASLSSSSSSSVGGRGNAVWSRPMRPPARVVSPLSSEEFLVTEPPSPPPPATDSDDNKGQNLVDAIRILSLRAAMTLTKSDGPCWQPSDSSTKKNSETGQNVSCLERVPETA